MSQADYDLIQEQIAEYHIGDRTTSAALLAWFLRTAWRIDPEDIDDAICDASGDKGIDALVVNDDLQEIAIFQSKHHKKHGGQQGDKDAKNLFGATAYFKTPQAVDGLLASSPNEELRKLLDRQDIRKRVQDGSHVTRIVFVTDGTLDPAGRDYVKAISGQEPDLEAWDQPKLAAVAQRTHAPELREVDLKLKAVAAPTQTTLDGSAATSTATLISANSYGSTGPKKVS